MYVCMRVREEDWNYLTNGFGNKQNYYITSPSSIAVSFTFVASLHHSFHTYQSLRKQNCGKTFDSLSRCTFRDCSICRLNLSHFSLLEKWKRLSFKKMNSIRENVKRRVLVYILVSVVSTLYGPRERQRKL